MTALMIPIQTCNNCGEVTVPPAPSPEGYVLLTDLELEYLLAKIGGPDTMSLIRPGIFSGENVLALEKRLRDERDRRKAK